MSNLKIVRNGANLDFKSFVFPAGEIGVKLAIKEHFIAYSAKTGFFAPSSYQTIIARLQNSADIMELAMLTDALRRIDDTPIRLFMPCCPYGRQDRVCDQGESFSLKAFANLINSLGFQKVIIFDPHSSVTEAVFDNLKVVAQLEIINKWVEFINMGRACKLISSDAGANKKTFEIAKFFYSQDFVRCDKLRDLSNGNIKETIVYCDDFKGQDVLCCDDLVDGGRSFTELAKVCKSKNCGKFILYATHGIFSKGIKELFDNGIDSIYTTNSYSTKFVNGCGVGVLDIEEKFKELL